MITLEDVWYAVLELRTYAELGGGPMVEALFRSEDEALDWIRETRKQDAEYPSSVLYVVVKTVAGVA
jgi:hypothetical protein